MTTFLNPFPPLPWSKNVKLDTGIGSFTAEEISDGEIIWTWRQEENVIATFLEIESGVIGPASLMVCLLWLHGEHEKYRNDLYELYAALLEKYL